MRNVDRLLAELVGRGLLNRPSEKFLQWFLGRVPMRDIKNADIDSLVGEMSKLNFKEKSHANSDLLGKKFGRAASQLAAGGAIAGALGEGISSEDLNAMMFIFCRVAYVTEIGS